LYQTTSGIFFFVFEDFQVGVPNLSLISWMKCFFLPRINHLNWIKRNKILWSKIFCSYHVLNYNHLILIQ
jgi:hypothetical protein